MATKVLITGATGLIGRHVAIVLQNKFQLILSASSHRNIPQGSVIPFDLQRIELMHEFLDELAPDVVVHTAGITSIHQAAADPEKAMLVNRDATAAIATWCNMNHRRLIHFSTDFVFDGRRKDYVEADVPGPLSLYGKSKLESEWAVQSIHPNHVIIRPILVYGWLPDLPRLNFPLLVASKLKAKETMHITADQYRMPTSAVDVALAVAALIPSPFRGVLHLCGPEYLSVYDFALQVADAHGLDQELLVPVSTEPDPGGDQRPIISGFDTSLARALIHWNPRSFKDSLQLIR